MGETNEAPVLVDRDGPVAVVRFNRSNVMNAISPESEDLLHEHFQELDADCSIRAIVLTGSGRAFSAGYDMGRKREKPPTADGILHDWWDRDMSGFKHLLAMMEMKTPIIGAVNGWALGGGFWYCLATDVTFAAESAVFAQPEVRHVSNTSFLFAMLCGYKNAHRYGLTGDHFDAQEALRIGVVNEVVPDDQLQDVAMAYAQRVALVPTSSVRINKAVTNLGLQAMGLRAAMNLNAALSVIAHASADTEETADLQQALSDGDMREFLKMRDTPFFPEPGGPRRKARG